MNYIRHLNNFFIRLEKDGRMTPHHISLYMALFQMWNLERFADEFTIMRFDIMKIARIGSVNTYARCMRNLEEWGYIRYRPASNLYSGSKVSCIRFDTATDIATDTSSDTGIKSDTPKDTASDSTGNTSSDTLLINIRNKYKQEEKEGSNQKGKEEKSNPTKTKNLSNHPKPQKHGKQFNQSSAGRLDASTGKDYSEPL